MKKWSILLGLIVIILIGGYLGLSYYGVKLVQPQLQKMLGPGFTLKEIQVKLTHLSMKGIQYEGLHTKKKYLWIEEIKIYPAIISLFVGPLRIRDFTIREPSLSFYRTKEGVFVGPWAVPEKKEKREPSGDQEQKEREQVFLKIDRLRIQKGSIDFEDWKPGEPPARLKLRDIDLEMKEIQYPFHSTRSPVELKGRLEGKTKKDGEILAKGWINLKTTDMETSLNVREIEVRVFEPYYRKKVSAEIDSGYMAMDTKITSEGEDRRCTWKVRVDRSPYQGGRGNRLLDPCQNADFPIKREGEPHSSILSYEGKHRGSQVQSSGDPPDPNRHIPFRGFGSSYQGGG